MTSLLHIKSYCDKTNKDHLLCCTLVITVKRARFHILVTVIGICFWVHGRMCVCACLRGCVSVGNTKTTTQIYMTFSGKLPSVKSYTFPCLVYYKYVYYKALG